jgi:hypothetical protein
MATQKEELALADYERVLKCQKLFEPLYERSNLTGGEISKLSKVSYNPLYQTLKDQIDEREYYLALV